MFNYEFYKQNAQIEGPRRELIEHYLTEGSARGLSPSPHFDPDFYRRTYTDVARANAEPFEHYVLNGRREGRYPNRTLLFRDIHRIRTSGLFDETFYRLRYPLLPEADAVEHFLLASIALRSRPRPDFDPEFYVKYYPDWTDEHNPFVHYVQSRGSHWIFRNADNAEKVAEIVRKSEHFDEEFYVDRYLSSDETIDAALHYCTIGFRRGYNPSRSFDTAYYLNSNHDIRKAKLNPLWHYEVAGKAERRGIFADLATVTKAGKRPFDPDKRTILVCCHDSNRTGAPILGLNLVAYLSQEFNVFTWLGRDGDLREDFADFSYLTVVLDPAVARATLQTEVLLRGQNLAFAVLNSVEASVMAPILWRADIPIVSLIHEFAQYTHPRGKLSRAIMFSDQVVMPAEVVRESALSELSTFLVDVAPSNIAIRPQGRSVVGMGGAREGDASRAELYARMGVDPNAADGERPFVVFGAGWVQPRKGVEYFIGVARRLKQCSDRDVRFIWVGGNYEPDKDLTYSVWLHDEIVRSGLEDTVLFFDEQGSLDLFWQTADAFLLTSRLDPFPNVVLDAIAHEVPVVCFEKATGVAEHAGRPGLGIEAVPYLDVAAAADALARIARGTGPKVTDTPERAELLDLRAYVETVVACGEKAREIAEGRRGDLKVIADSGLFDQDFFATACPHWLQPDELAVAYTEPPLAKLYVTLAHRDVYLAKSRRGFHDRRYAEATGLEHGAALALAARAEDTASTHAVFYPGVGASEPPAPTSRTALHIHLHYTDLAHQLLHALLIADCRADLFISTTSAEKAATLRNIFSAFLLGAVEVVEVPNRGRDIGPFLTAWPGRWQEYPVVGHIHGKKSVDLDSSRGDEWRDFILQRLLGDRKTFRGIIAAFSTDERLGLMFPEDPNIVGWTENREPARSLLDRLGLSASLPAAIEFPLGTMFWARPDALAPLLRAGFTADDFPAEPLPYDGSMLHAMERILPIVCTASGYSWRTSDRLDDINA